jgi:hypothetical protein
LRRGREPATVSTPSRDGYVVSQRALRSARNITREDRENYRTGKGITLDSLIEEVDHYIERCDAVKQYSALSSLITAKAKLLGLMSDAIRIETVDLTSALAEARARALQPPTLEGRRVIPDIFAE